MSDMGWFWAWTLDHFARHANSGAPNPDGDATEQRSLEILRREWAEIGMTREAAVRASERMLLEAVRPAQHLPLLRKLALDSLKTAASVTTLSREEAARKSFGCPECDGLGLTGRRVPPPERYRDHPAYRQGVSVTCYCHRCAMGRWMRSAHDSELASRIIDLAERPDLQEKSSCSPHAKTAARSKRSPPTARHGGSPPTSRCSSCEPRTGSPRPWSGSGLTWCDPREATRRRSLPPATRPPGWMPGRSRRCPTCRRRKRKWGRRPITDAGPESNPQARRRH